MAKFHGLWKALLRQYLYFTFVCGVSRLPLRNFESVSFRNAPGKGRSIGVLAYAGGIPLLHCSYAESGILWDFVGVLVSLQVLYYRIVYRRAETTANP